MYLEKYKVILHRWRKRLAFENDYQPQLLQTKMDDQCTLTQIEGIQYGLVELISSFHFWSVPVFYGLVRCSIMKQVSRNAVVKIEGGQTSLAITTAIRFTESKSSCFKIGNDSIYTFWAVNEPFVPNPTRSDQRKIVGENTLLST